MLQEDEAGGGADDGGQAPDGGGIGDAQRQTLADHLVVLGLCTFLSSWFLELGVRTGGFSYQRKVSELL